MKSNLEKLRNCPHVVILGAGASVAAIPNGDKYGRKISVMNGFIDNLGMRDILSGIKFKSENLEDVYSELSSHKEYDVIRQQLECRIHDYFVDFQIPDEPTIYDLLLLSLKGKDIVASFNWDPLLIQAWYRVRKITENLPQILFLHGNVWLQLCYNDKKTFFCRDPWVCKECDSFMTPSRLLYPVCQKDYNSDPFVKNQWDVLRYNLRQAYIVTIFGYSAPSTDVEAKQLLLDAWGGGDNRKLEQIEIIDIKTEDELRGTWDDFIFTHHYETHSTFYDSLIARSPRKSTEDTFDCLMNCKWLDFSYKLSPEMSWDQVKEHFRPILSDENALDCEVQNEK